MQDRQRCDWPTCILYRQGKTLKLNLAFQNPLKGTEVCFQERITVGKVIHPCVTIALLPLTQPQILINFLPPTHPRAGTKGLIISHIREGKGIVRTAFKDFWGKKYYHISHQKWAWISSLLPCPNYVWEKLGWVPRACGIFLTIMKIISCKIRKKHLNFQLKKMLYYIYIHIYIISIQ